MNPFVSDWFAAAFNAVLCTTILPSTCVKGDEVVNLHINGSQTTFQVARRYLEQPSAYRVNDNVDDVLLLVTMPGVEGRTQGTAAQFHNPGQYGTVLVVNNPHVSLEDYFRHRTGEKYRAQSREAEDERYGLSHVKAVPASAAEIVFVPADIYELTTGALELFITCSDDPSLKIDFCNMFYNNRDLVVKAGFPRQMIGQWSNIRDRVNDVLKAD